MGHREDFMVVRRAAVHLDQAQPDTPVNPFACTRRLLVAAANREADFIRLTKAGIQGEVVDLAYAVLGETRPDGPAADWNQET